MTFDQNPDDMNGYAHKILGGSASLAVTCSRVVRNETLSAAAKNDGVGIRGVVDGRLDLPPQ